MSVIGCGSSGHDLVPVAGQVTVDGKPVTTGQVAFFPESGRPAIGSIDSDGRYELKTYEPGDGAEPGKYRVTITARNIPPDDGPTYSSFEDEMRGVSAEPAQPKCSRASSPRITWIVPEKYSSRSSTDLEVEVNSDGEDIDFQLQSNP